MPIYSYQCQDCRNQLDVFSGSFEVGEETCPRCHSKNIKGILTVSLVRMGKVSEPPSEFFGKGRSRRLLQQEENEKLVKPIEEFLMKRE